MSLAAITPTRCTGSTTCPDPSVQRRTKTFRNPWSRLGLTRSSSREYERRLSTLNQAKYWPGLQGSPKGFPEALGMPSDAVARRRKPWVESCHEPSPKDVRCDAIYARGYRLSPASRMYSNVDPVDHRTGEFVTLKSTWVTPSLLADAATIDAELSTSDV